ncbi:MAG: sodium ion-translocating decarboxylase subunit beta, partial [Alistipes sp.]|nr:sodium ion-translocating decarboxylase subunit beta [Alistipes sp.]
MLNLLQSNFALESLEKFLSSMGFAAFFSEMGWGNLVMILIAFFLLYLAIKKEYEPMLMMTIAFGMLLTNLPGAGLFHEELFAGGHVHWSEFSHGAGLLDYLYLGVKLGIYPCLIFVGVGAMTDFGPLIANPKSFLLGAAAQVGIFATFLAAYAMGFTPEQAGSIGIIGGADGPTAIFLTARLAPELLGPIAVAAYSYMALVPVIQPPIMRALTTKKERMIKMSTLRQVSKKERILFPIVIAAIISLILPDAAPLIGCLMLGNLMKESGVVDRPSKTVQNELMNIVV